MTTPGGDSSPSGPQWSLDDERAYERALDLLGAITATYSALIDQAYEAGDEEREERLVAESLRHDEFRRSLSPRNRADNERVLAEYPAVLERLRAQT